MFKSTIQLDSFYLSKNANAKNEALMVVCNGSFYRDRNQKLQKNVLDYIFPKMKAKGGSSETVHCSTNCLNMVNNFQLFFF